MFSGRRDKQFSVTLSPVDVFKPDDIIFIEITSRLNFDKEGRNLSRICQSMLLAKWDVGRLVFAEQLHRVALGDFQRTLDYDPMLGAMEMALQGQFSAGLHHNAFHLIAVAAIE